jgi:translation initiation factor IF-1
VNCDLSLESKSAQWFSSITPVLVEWVELVTYNETKMSQSQDWEMKEKRNRKRMAKSKKNSNGRYESETEMYERDDRMELHGVVADALPGTWFRVVTESNVKILATLSGKMRQNNIRILPGDYVVVEVSPYDTSRGRITYRM